MRKLIFIGFIVAGSAVGLLSTLGDGWGLRVVMMTIGAVVGAAIGGALTRVGKRPTTLRHVGVDEPYGQGMSAEDRDRNYWRDKGNPPFMKPPSAEPDRRMFDLDRLD
jgi:hypothetical protein